MNLLLEMLVLGLVWLGTVDQPATFELATTIGRTDGTVTVDASGYAKMNLLRMKVDHTGTITLNGVMAVEGGEANVVLWANVQGKYYFSKMPVLQGFDKADFTTFAIPFRSPESPITEIVLDVELPNGGKLQIKDLDLKKG